MIGKIFPKSSGSFKTRLRYIFGCSKHDHAISQIKTLVSNSLCPDPLPGVLAGDLSILNKMIDEFDSVEKLRDMSVDSERKIKPIFHAMLSLKPGEHLSIEQWQYAIRTFMEDLGFKDTNKYVAVMHGDTDREHAHVVANRIEMDEDFRLVKDSNERSACIDSVSDIEDALGLSKAPRPSETWGIAYTHAEVVAADKNNDIPFKARMIAKIAGAIEQTQAENGDMLTLVRHLRKQQVYIHLTKNEEGQPKGISYEFNGKTISGRKLKRSRLTFQKLTQQEGISYDPETLHSLEIEIARKDQDDQTRIAERFFYVGFYSRTRRFAVKFEPKSRNQREIDELVEAIQAFLSAIFGVPFESKKEQGRREARYVEYVPAPGLTRAMFGAPRRERFDISPQL